MCLAGTSRGHPLREIRVSVPLLLLSFPLLLFSQGDRSLNGPRRNPMVLATCSLLSRITLRRSRVPNNGRVPPPCVLPRASTPLRPMLVCQLPLLPFIRLCRCFAVVIISSVHIRISVCHQFCYYYPVSFFALWSLLWLQVLYYNFILCVIGGTGHTVG